MDTSDRFKIFPTCKKCSQFFESDLLFEFHKLECFDIKPTCLKCDMIFGGVISAGIHYVQHYPKAEHDCEFNVQIQSNLTTEKRPYRSCPKCHSQLRSNRARRLHRIKFGGKNRSCHRSPRT